MKNAAKLFLKENYFHSIAKLFPLECYFCSTPIQYYTTIYLRFLFNAEAICSSPTINAIGNAHIDKHTHISSPIHILSQQQSYQQVIFSTYRRTGVHMLCHS